jgi:hypothetical protein
LTGVHSEECERVEVEALCCAQKLATNRDSGELDEMASHMATLSSFERYIFNAQ